MTLEQAGALASALNAAIAQAAKTGTEVDLAAQLRALDDDARAELQAAIDARAG